MKKCVYCLKSLQKTEATKDHIFPNSWYASTTLNSVQRWTVPACRKCNQDLKLSEEEVFLSWAITLDPIEAAAEGLTEKIKKMINLESSKNTDIFRIREAALLKILSRFTEYDPARTHKNLGPKDGVRGSLAVTTPSKAINDLARKIITGLEYKIRRKYIENDRKFKSYFPKIDDPLHDYYLKWGELIEPIKKTIVLTPSFRVDYGINPGFDQAIYHISIWNHYEIWGLVLPRAK